MTRSCGSLDLRVRLLLCVAMMTDSLGVDGISVVYEPTQAKHGNFYVQYSVFRPCWQAKLDSTRSNRLIPFMIWSITLSSPKLRLELCVTSFGGALGLGSPPFFLAEFARPAIYLAPHFGLSC